MKLNLDSRIRCTDHTKVRLADVVIEPVSKAVTHVVIEHDGLHRIVPIRDLDDGPNGLRLKIPTSELDRYPVIDTSDLLRIDDVPVATPGWAIGITAPLALPHFIADFDAAWLAENPATTWHRVPIGDVEVRRDSIVVGPAGDEVGHVDGFVCDGDGHITHLVLRHGHVYGHHDLAIPIVNVTAIANDLAVIDLDRATIEALPAVSVHRWHHPR